MTVPQYTLRLGKMSNSKNFNKDQKASMAEGYDTPMTTNKYFDFVAWRRLAVQETKRRDQYTID